MNRVICLFITVSAIILVSCVQGEKSAKGFRLPDGNIERGMLAYATLGCAHCHKVINADVPFDGDLPPVMLGGEITKVKTYGELVTSIINPSHKIGKGVDPRRIIDDQSAMAFAGINHIMTVQELIDLVAFLQDQYEIVPPEVDHYPPFHAP